MSGTVHVYSMADLKGQLLEELKGKFAETKGKLKPSHLAGENGRVKPGNTGSRRKTVLVSALVVFAILLLVAAALFFLPPKGKTLGVFNPAAVADNRGFFAPRGNNGQGMHPVRTQHAPVQTRKIMVLVAICTVLFLLACLYGVVFLYKSRLSLSTYKPSQDPITLIMGRKSMGRPPRSH